jgi:hypothetical protein
MCYNLVVGRHWLRQNHAVERCEKLKAEKSKKIVQLIIVIATEAFCWTFVFCRFAPVFCVPAWENVYIFFVPNEYWFQVEVGLRYSSLYIIHLLFGSSLRRFLPQYHQARRLWKKNIIFKSETSNSSSWKT